MEGFLEPIQSQPRHVGSETGVCGSPLYIYSVDRRCCVFFHPAGRFDLTNRLPYLGVAK